MQLSVVVLAKDARSTIRGLVTSLMGQTTKPHEVIVVLDSPQDTTRESLIGLPVRIVYNGRGGFASGRNRGWLASSGRIVAFIDADCVADSRWIETLCSRFVDPAVEVQAGRTLPGKMGAIPGVTNPPGPAERGLYLVSHAPTMNLALRRDVLAQIGGFDPWFDVAGEDTDLCLRLRQAGIRIYYNPGALVYHYGGTGPRKAWRAGKATARTVVKHMLAPRGDVWSFMYGSAVLGALYLFAVGVVLNSLPLTVGSVLPVILLRLHSILRNRARARQSDNTPARAPCMARRGAAETVVQVMSPPVSHLTFTISTCLHLLAAFWRYRDMGNN